MQASPELQARLGKFFEPYNQELDEWMREHQLLGLKLHVNATHF
jgi:hypothetical protein